MGGWGPSTRLVEAFEAGGPAAFELEDWEGWSRQEGEECEAVFRGVREALALVGGLTVVVCLCAVWLGFEGPLALVGAPCVACKCAGWLGFWAGRWCWWGPWLWRCFTVGLGFERGDGAGGTLLPGLVLDARRGIAF